MKKISKYITVLVILCTSFKALAFDCSGDVDVPSFKIVSIANLTFFVSNISQLVIGDKILLAHPLTEDTEQEVELVIKNIEILSDGLDVIAYSNIEDMLVKFKVNTKFEKINITDFKGFEKNIFFGSATLNCN